MIPLNLSIVTIKPVTIKPDGQGLEVSKIDEGDRGGIEAARNPESCINLISRYAKPAHI